MSDPVDDDGVADFGNPDDEPTGFPMDGYVNPIIRRSFVGGAFDRDYLLRGEIHARGTYDRIVTELQGLRTTKADLQDRINELVGAERIWQPIINRLDTGIQHRTKDEPEQDSLLDEPEPEAS
jgi:hypothetical protein